VRRAERQMVGLVLGGWGTMAERRGTTAGGEKEAHRRLLEARVFGKKSQSLDPRSVDDGMWTTAGYQRKSRVVGKGVRPLPRQRG